MSPRRLVDADFLDRISPEPNTGCHLWLGEVDRDGYGTFGRPQSSGTKRLAHRYSYERTFGPIPTGMHVLHRCDTPPCVNPDHFFLGTQRDNVCDMDAKGRSNRGVTQRAKAHCKYGHPYDEENTLVRVNGSRGCRTCHRTRERERYRQS